MLRFTEQWASNREIDLPLIGRLSQSLSSRDFVILAATIGQASFTSRFNVVFGIELP